MIQAVQWVELSQVRQLLIRLEQVSHVAVIVKTYEVLTQVKQTDELKHVRQLVRKEEHNWQASSGSRA